MAEEKKGVIFYCDLIHTFEKLILKDIDGIQIY